MKLKLFAIAILLTSLMAGCMEQKELAEQITETPLETVEVEQPATEEVQEITTLESDISEIDELLNELQELEELNFDI
jgi:PBP1b-binding outer membrane lipoprotein LpoB